MARTSKSKWKKVTVKKTARNGKGATIVELLRRKEGATLADLTKATGWQPHSVRGFRQAKPGGFFTARQPRGMAVSAPQLAHVAPGCRPGLSIPTCPAGTPTAKGS